MEFSFQIHPGSEVPIYKQIVDQFRHAIATGKLTAGDAVPSIRALAQRLIVNQNTVVKAYAQLVQEGLIRSEKGRGLFVAAPRKVYSQAELERRLNDALDRMVSDVVMLGYSKKHILKLLSERLSEIPILKE
jgi:GntR family transcriptional regulator